MGGSIGMAADTAKHQQRQQQPRLKLPALPHERAHLAGAHCNRCAGDATQLHHHIWLPCPPHIDVDDCSAAGAAQRRSAEVQG